MLLLSVFTFTDESCELGREGLCVFAGACYAPSELRPSIGISTRGGASLCPGLVCWGPLGRRDATTTCERRHVGAAVFERRRVDGTDRTWRTYGTVCGAGVGWCGSSSLRRARVPTSRWIASWATILEAWRSSLGAELTRRTSLLDSLERLSYGEASSRSNKSLDCAMGDDTRSVALFSWFGVHAPNFPPRQPGKAVLRRGELALQQVVGLRHGRRHSKRGTLLFFQTSHFELQTSLRDSLERLSYIGFSYRRSRY